jgi:hypothetical protein
MGGYEVVTQRGDLRVDDLEPARAGYYRQVVGFVGDGEEAGDGGVSGGFEVGCCVCAGGGLLRSVGTSRGGYYWYVLVWLWVRGWESWHELLSWPTSSPIANFMVVVG